MTDLLTEVPDVSHTDSEVVNLNISSYFSDPDTSDALTFSGTNLPPGLKPFLSQHWLIGKCSTPMHRLVARTR